MYSYICMRTYKRKRHRILKSKSSSSIFIEWKKKNNLNNVLYIYYKTVNKSCIFFNFFQQVYKIFFKDILYNIHTCVFYVLERVLYNSEHLTNYDTRSTIIFVLCARYCNDTSIGCVLGLNEFLIDIIILPFLKPAQILDM